MTKPKQEHRMVLSIDPTSRGFGFTVFEGPKKLIDWGRSECRVNKNARALKKIKKLMNFYEPDVVVLEDCDENTSLRHLRIRNLLSDLSELAEGHGIGTIRYSRARIREVFAMFGASTKYEVAKTIAEFMTELSPRLPPKRQAWMNEDERLGIFDAAALGITYYYLEE